MGLCEREIFSQGKELEGSGIDRNVLADLVDVIYVHEGKRLSIKLTFCLLCCSILKK